MNHHLHGIGSIICGAALLCAATGAAAQSIYRQVDAFGRVSFTDQPETAPQLQTTGDSAAEAPRARTGRAPIASKRAAQIDATEATRRLEQALLKRKQGAAPLPGEQVQGPKGSVPNYRYWQRQEKLRLLVEQAQQRWRETNQTVLARR